MTTAELVSVAIQLDQTHVVFPSSLSIPQHPGQGPGVLYGDGPVRGAMSDEHLAPISSAVSDQIPPGIVRIPPIEQFKHLAHFG